MSLLSLLSLSLPSPAQTAAVPSPSAAASDSAGPTLTLRTSTLRNAATNLPPLSSRLAWLDTLPDLRLRMNWENPISPTSPSDWTAFGIRGVEIQLPSAPGLWLGVEDSSADDPSTPLRATISIQKAF